MLGPELWSSAIATPVLNLLDISSAPTLKTKTKKKTFCLELTDILIVSSLRHMNKSVMSGLP